MAMQTGSEEDAITDINVTPLVDISLVLVIIFMAVAPFAIQAGIKVLKSKTKVSVGKVASSENVNVRLRATGEIEVNGKSARWETLQTILNSALAKSADKMVILTADYKNRVGEVVEVLDISKQSGAKKLAIMKATK